MDEAVFNLIAIIEKWQVDYCKWVPAKKSGCLYPQVPFNQRKELLTILVLQIKSAGKPKDYFSSSRRDDIVKEIIPRGRHLERSMIEGFRNATRKMLNWVIEECYPENEKADIKIEAKSTESPKSVIKIFDPTRFKDRDDKEPPIEDVVDEEMAELLGLNDKNE
jgi:hypothetical protein